MRSEICDSFLKFARDSDSETKKTAKAPANIPNGIDQVVSKSVPKVTMAVTRIPVSWARLLGMSQNRTRPAPALSGECIKG